MPEILERALKSIAVASRHHMSSNTLYVSAQPAAIIKLLWLPHLSALAVVFIVGQTDDRFGRFCQVA